VVHNFLSMTDLVENRTV